MTQPSAAPRRRRPEPVQEALPFVLPEGVHLGLPFQFYIDSRALGSSDFGVLADDPHSWWYGSPFNPDRKDRKKRSPALAFGSALHALGLEGEDAYRARFVVEPDPESNRYARTRDAMRTLLASKGVRIPKGDLFDDVKMRQLCTRAGVAHLVWDYANADYLSAKRKGLEYVTEDEDRRLRHMVSLMRKHADLGPGLRKGLAEVSVFWRDPRRPNVLLRARFDKLQPLATIDLKTFSNIRDRTTSDATLDAIADHGYDLQAEHYREARAWLSRFVAEGKVYSWGWRGGEEFPETVHVLKDEREQLNTIAAQEQWRWIWIFYQVRNDTAGFERAPIVQPWWMWPEGAMFNDARRVIDRALDNYERLVGEFGLTQPWSQIHPIRELPLGRMKRLSIKRSMQLDQPANG